MKEGGKSTKSGVRISIHILAVLVLFSIKATSQSPSLGTFIGNKDGFDESTVYAILKDRKGFIWYGTSSGLWRYDGYQHKRFEHEPKNPNSLSHNFVTCLIVDREVSLCAGTLDGG
jgi:ligand-binding sensor domain-containing protein